jgi:DNA-binding PadR family transcriptional regulator
LREPTFFILLSLADGEKHGYAILKDIEELSNGKITLSTGTLYGALTRMLEQGYIQRVPTPEKRPTPGLPRKAYRLTDFGLQVLQAETKRMLSLVHTAQLRLEEQEA